MKKLFVLLPLAALFSCSDNKDAKDVQVKGESTTADKPAEKPNYPYAATYSSQFEMGDTKHTMAVMNLWKMYDANDFSKAAELFADTVETRTAEGWHEKTGRDSSVAHIKSYRSMFSNVNSSVIAVVPVRSTDRNESWALIWGKEVHTKDGKTDSVFLHEAWMFNKDGKIAAMEQWAQMPAPPKK